MILAIRWVSIASSALPALADHPLSGECSPGNCRF
jgi:hypothetical protein